jgi:hypothetical protein
MIATPRLFGFDPPIRGTLLPALGHENKFGPRKAAIVKI